MQPWTGFVGQYDNRIWDRQFNKIEFKCDANVVGIKRATSNATTSHGSARTGTSSGGNEAYQFSYIFKYAMDMPEGAGSVTLPDNNEDQDFCNDRKQQ